MQPQQLSPQTPIAKELLKVPSQAAVIHDEIVQILQQIDSLKCASCLEPEFKKKYFRFMELFEEYQNIVVAHNKYRVSCHRGCAHCCNHWVEDVNSFEAEIIAEYVRQYYPDAVNGIISQCEEDVEILGNIEELTQRKIDKHIDSSGIDPLDLMLSVFYQMKRPCPLLSESGGCSVYKVRPLTCRIYMSFSEPALCAPEYQEEDDIPTYLLNVEENASSILDELHFRYQRFPEMTGLRSLLLNYLKT